MFSIVIPVYNAKASLERCVDSWLCQTRKDLEIILVDDGSSDGSGELSDRLTENSDGRVRVIHQENSGVSAARNAGIRAAKGEFLLFTDSDDYVEPDYLEKMAALQEKSDADLVLCGYHHLYDGADIVKVPGETHVSAMADFQQEFLELYKKSDLNMPWNKLYRKALAGEFDTSLSLGEDLLFNLELMKEDNLKICGTSKILYNYIIFDGLSSEKLQYYSKNRLEATLYLYKEMKDIGLKYGYSKEYSKVIDRIYGDKIIFCYKEWSVLNELFEEKKRKVAKLVGSKEISEINVKYINSIPKKIIFVLFKIKAVSFLTFMLMVTGDKDANNK